MSIEEAMERIRQEEMRHEEENRRKYEEEMRECRRLGMIDETGAWDLLRVWEVQNGIGV
jgi:rubrerythrin